MSWQPRSEAGDWWYATARLQVTVLGIICWSKNGGRTYRTYCSHCLDQSTPFALTCVENALELEEAASYSRQVIWADCGGHFRSCRFIGEVLCKAVQDRQQLLSSELHFFAEGHGKGPLRRTLRQDVEATPPNLRLSLAVVVCSVVCA